MVTIWLSSLNCVSELFFYLLLTILTPYQVPSSTYTIPVYTGKLGATEVHPCLFRPTYRVIEFS